MLSTEKYAILERCIVDDEIPAVDVLGIFCDYFGLQILEDGFMQHVKDEGYEIEWEEEDE